MYIQNLSRAIVVFVVMETMFFVAIERVMQCRCCVVNEPNVEERNIESTFCWNPMEEVETF